MLSVSERDEARRLVALIDALYEARVQLYVAAAAPLDELFGGLLDGRAASQMVGGAEVEVGEAGGACDSTAPNAPSAPSFVEAPVAGHYRADGELAAFFTAKDEAFMLRRTRSRLVEMCGIDCH